jgi:hypothetical protein
LDSKNNLYVGYTLKYKYTSQVRRYSPEVTRGIDLLPSKTVAFHRDLRSIKNGYLVVTRPEPTLSTARSCAAPRIPT